MYHQPYKLAKEIQAASGSKHLEGVHHKGNRWYARARAGKGNVIELSFKKEEHAYYCWVGIVKCREAREMEADDRLTTADRVDHINKLGIIGIESDTGDPYEL